MLITHARIGIKNSWPRIGVLYWEGGIKAGFCIVIRCDHVHEISRKDRGRKREAKKEKRERDVTCQVRFQTLQERNWGRIGLPRLADQADVTQPGTCDSAVRSDLRPLRFTRFSMRKGKLIRMQVPSSASSSVARVLSVSPGYQACFRLEWLPFSRQTYLFLFLIRFATWLFFSKCIRGNMNNFLLQFKRETKQIQRI